MNKKIEVAMTGFVATEPKYHVSEKGTAYITFRLAHSYAQFDSTKETWIEDPTIWFTVKAWGNLATNLHESISKSEPVYVAGRLRKEVWEKNDGKQNEDLIIEASTVSHDLGRGSTKFSRNSSGTIFNAETQEQSLEDSANPEEILESESNREPALAV
jgi:single-strand DNA-binding protein